MRNRHRGFIELIIIVIIGIALLSYLKIDLRSLFESEWFKNNLQYVWNVLSFIWEQFLKGPVTMLWNLILEWLKTK